MSGNFYLCSKYMYFPNAFFAILNTSFLAVIYGRYKSVLIRLIVLQTSYYRSQKLFLCLIKYS